MSNNLETFGEVFINEVRDRTIRVFDKRVDGIMKDTGSQELYREVQLLNDSQRGLIHKIISQVTDLSLHNMLCMFEEHEEVALVMNGENITEASDGLSGELYTEDGWIKKYSKQRMDV